MTETITTAPHGRCDDCKVDLATPDRVQEHLRETQAASPERRSHRIWRLNPTAQQRVERAVERAVEEALDAFCEDMDEAVRRGEVTDAEVSQELRYSGDFASAWENWLTENRDDDED